MLTLHYSSIDKEYIEDQKKQWDKAVLSAFDYGNVCGALVCSIYEVEHDFVTFYEFDVVFDIAGSAQGLKKIVSDSREATTSFYK